VKGQTVNCDRCNVKRDIEYKQGYVKKHNPASPWRLKQRRAEKLPQRPQNAIRMQSKGRSEPKIAPRWPCECNGLPWGREIEI
jgi:hypothetical protein